MSDRGYRDEVGAAVERLATLEEENAELRAELDRLGAPKKRARVWSTGAKVLLLGVAFGMTLGAFARGFSCPRGHHHHGASRTHVNAFVPHGVVNSGRGHSENRDDRASRPP